MLEKALHFKPQINLFNQSDGDDAFCYHYYWIPMMIIVLFFF